MLKALGNGQAGAWVKAEPGGDPGRTQEGKVVAGHQDRAAGQPLRPVIQGQQQAQPVKVDYPRYVWRHHGQRGVADLRSSPQLSVGDITTPP
jgi:hypothetical protein